ncbi:uncharacterized protein LOC135383929 isoform X2 [Ornithodoros turicata]
MISNIPAANWRGYPQLFTQKTSSLLSEALQMLHRAKDIKERRWLEAYIQRLAALADELEQSTTFVKTPTASSSAHTSQQTVPTTGQISPPPSGSRERRRSTTTTESSVNQRYFGIGKPRAVTLPSFPRQNLLQRDLRRESQRREATVTTESHSFDPSGVAVPLGPTAPLDAGNEDKDGAPSAAQKLIQQILQRARKLIGLGVTDGEIFRALQKHKNEEAVPETNTASTRATLAPTAQVDVSEATSAVRDDTSGEPDDLVRQLEREKVHLDRWPDSWSSRAPRGRRRETLPGILDIDRAPASSPRIP